MSTGVGKGNECVNVVVRCRPMLDKETKAGHERVVDMDTNHGVVVIKNPSKPNETPREFTFDFVYDWNSRQADLYEKTFQPLVSSVLEGYNGTIFAYGQTGTGKTYTMEGVRSDPNKRGVIPNSFEHIFTHINESKDQQYLVRASYLEIYQDEIRDLLSKDHKRRLDLKERPDTGVYVKDLSSFIAKSVKEIEHVMIIGNQNRAVGPTDMNEHSSRSHAIFIVTVECSEIGVDGNDHIRVGKLNLVDLAGSERQSKTQATGDRFKEATKINLSLSALGNVISALVNSKSTHIPYRDSKLTYLLQDSLGGNSKTVMVANIGPASYNYEESLVTLRYANRAKNIKNKPRINEDPKDALLREYQNEIKRLKEALEVRKKGKKRSGSSRKKKRRNGGTKNDDDNTEQELCSNSSDGSEGEEGEDSSEEGERNEEMLKRLQDDLEKERKSVQENTEMVEEEKQVLLAKIHKKFEEVKSERKKLAQLASKIQAMESKLLSGAGIIRIAEDQRDMRKRDIQQKRDEMIEMKKRAQHIQKELEERAETNVEVQGSYQSLHEETSSKEKKLKKLQKKLKSIEAELSDCKGEQYQMREELNEQLLVLEKEMKLRSLIIEHFIPENEVNHIKSMLVYDQDKQTWSSKGQNKDTTVDKADDGTPTVVSPHPLITEEFITKHNIILRLDLDMPTRTTCDYEEPQVTPTVQAVIDKAIEDPEDMTIDASLFSERRSSNNKSGYVKHSDIPSHQFRLKEKAMKTQTTDPSQQFPVKRGLVKTK